MIYMVELRYFGGNLVDLMRDMRSWLDHKQIEAEEFHHSSGTPGLAFRIGFRKQDDAAAFAEAFGGLVGSANPPSIGVRWTTPPDTAAAR